MIQALGPIALALCASPSVNTAPQSPLLASVPADSIFVASCDDPAALRANLLSHQFVRLFDGGSGTPYVTAITDLILSEPEGGDVLGGLEFAKRFCDSFDGPIVAFANTSGAGFMTTSTRGGVKLRAALDEMLIGMPEAEISDRGTHRGFQLRSIKPKGRGRGVMIRAEWQSVTGLFMGEGDVLSAAKDSIQRYISQASSDIGAQLLNARPLAGATGSRSAIDFMLDISRIAEMSGAQEASEMGLTEDCWIYGRVDLGGPTQAEAVLDLRLPERGPIPAFLNVLKPVMADDLKVIPSDALSLTAIQIDLELLLETIIEEGGPEAEDSIDQVRQASIGATGRDLIDELFLGMTGYFATYELEPPTNPDDISSVLGGQGVFALGVHDSEEMLEVLDDLVSVGGVDSMIDFRDYKDIEMWVVDVDGLSPALAFMEGHLLFSMSTEYIERAIDHAMTPGSKSILQSPAGRQLLEYGTGGFFVSYLDTALAAWRTLNQAAMVAELTPELQFLSNMPQIDLAAVKREVRGLTISSFVRTAKGLLYRAESR